MTTSVPATVASRCKKHTHTHLLIVKASDQINSVERETHRRKDKKSEFFCCCCGGSQKNKKKRKKDERPVSYFLLQHTRTSVS